MTGVELLVTAYVLVGVCIVWDEAPRCVERSAEEDARDSYTVAFTTHYIAMLALVVLWLPCAVIDGVRR